MCKEENPFNMGDKVIVRSNEWDEPLKIGIYNGQHAKHKTVPIIDINGEMFTCMGVVVPYSEELLTNLSQMSTKEQWNHLSRNLKCKDSK